MNELTPYIKRRKRNRRLGTLCLLIAVAWVLGGTLNLLLNSLYDQISNWGIAETMRTGFQRVFWPLVQTLNDNNFLRSWLLFSPKPTFCFLSMLKGNGFCISFGDIWYFASIALSTIGWAFIRAGDETAAFIRDIEKKIAEARILKASVQDNTQPSINQSGDVNVANIIELSLKTSDKKPKSWTETGWGIFSLGILVTVIGALILKLLNLG